MLKVYGVHTDGRVGINFRNPASEGNRTALNLHNRNTFVTSTYTGSRADGRWFLYTGLSYSHNADSITYDTSRMDRTDERVPLRAVLNRTLPGLSGGPGGSLLFGGEAHHLTLQNVV